MCGYEISLEEFIEPNQNVNITVASGNNSIIVQPSSIYSPVNKLNPKHANVMTL